MFHTGKFMKPMPLLSAVKLRIRSTASRRVSEEDIGVLVYKQAYNQLIAWTEARVGQRVSDQVWEHIQAYRWSQT